jgi:hypothetical protein
MVFLIYGLTFMMHGCAACISGDHHKEKFNIPLELYLL